MAAIDKLRLTSYYDREELILWCIEHRPKLLRRIYNVFDMSSKDFAEAQKDRARHCPDENIPPINVAHFWSEDDRYLYWRCPLPFIREYLREQCGYKDNWFVKLFWKW